MANEGDRELKREERYFWREEKPRNPFSDAEVWPPRKREARMGMQLHMIPALTSAALEARERELDFLISRHISRPTQPTACVARGYLFFFFVGERKLA